MGSDPSCVLSPQARAFSTVLTAFVGSIVNGATSGGVVALMTGWISWFAVLRVLSGASIGLYKSFSSDDGVSQDSKAIEQSILLRFRPLIRFERTESRVSREITVLGWIGWLYTAVYSPIVQILWLVENWKGSEGSLKMLRALGISVSALSLTIDIKKRYASRLSDAKYLGPLAAVAFRIVNSGSAFGMGIMCAALLVKGAIDIGLAWYIIMIYCVFSVIWAAHSFRICPVQDGGIKGWGLVPDVLMGVFAGIFLAAPAFAVMITAEQPNLTSNNFSTPDTGQASLQHYLSCDSVAHWQKFVAIFP